MFRILTTDDISPAGLALLQAAHDMSVDIVKRPERARLLGLIGSYDALVTRSATPLDAEAFAAAGKLKVAGRAGVGLDNVDVDAATAPGGMATSFINIDDPVDDAVAAALRGPPQLMDIRQVVI